jgi:hypothetical protein
LRRHYPSRSGLALCRHLPARPAAWRGSRCQQWIGAEEVIDKANARGLPLTSVVSVGNALHFGVEDYLASRTPLLHSMMGTLPGKTEWFAAMERAGVPMFNDVEEMAEAAGLLACYPRLSERARSDNLSDVRFRDRRGA